MQASNHILVHYDWFNSSMLVRLNSCVRNPNLHQWNVPRTGLLQSTVESHAKPRFTLDKLRL